MGHPRKGDGRERGQVRSEADRADAYGTSKHHFKHMREGNFNVSACITAQLDHCCNGNLEVKYKYCRKPSNPSAVADSP